MAQRPSSLGAQQEPLHQGDVGLGQGPALRHAKESDLKVENPLAPNEVASIESEYIERREWHQLQP